MSTPQGLFGDDDDEDSSDEDEQQSPTKQQAAPLETQKPEAAKDDDEDDDEDKKETTEEPPKKKKGLFADSDDEDDDDDEGDAEFDDKGAEIVGLDATAATTKPPPTSTATTRDGEDPANDDDADPGATGVRSPSATTRKRITTPKIDTRPLLIPRMLPRPTASVSLHITKLPNLIGIQTTAFDPNNYHPALEEEDFGPSAVHNLIRWRYKRDSAGHLARDADTDQLQRESNSRLVEWEDGTWTLHVGTEAFEVDAKDSAAPDGFCGLNGYIYLSQPANVAEAGATEAPTEQSPNAGTVLECLGGIRSRLTARPSSLQSEAHKSLTVAVRQRTIKKARIAEIATAEDPEKLKQERIKMKAELEKAQAAKKKQQGRGRGGGRHSGGGLSEDYLEGGDYDDYDISNEKRRLREDPYAGGYEPAAPEVSLEADETFNASRPTKRQRVGQRRRQQQQQEEEEEEEDDDEILLQNDDDDDDEDEVAPVVKNKKKPAHRSVFADDDESE